MGQPDTIGNLIKLQCRADSCAMIVYQKIGFLAYGIEPSERDPKGILEAIASASVDIKLEYKRIGTTRLKVKRLALVLDTYLPHIFDLYDSLNNTDCKIRTKYLELMTPLCSLYYDLKYRMCKMPSQDQPSLGFVQKQLHMSITRWLLKSPEHLADVVLSIERINIRADPPEELYSLFPLSIIRILCKKYKGANGMTENFLRHLLLFRLWCRLEVTESQPSMGEEILALANKSLHEDYGLRQALLRLPHIRDHLKGVPCDRLLLHFLPRGMQASSIEFDTVRKVYNKYYSYASDTREPVPKMNFRDLPAMRMLGAARSDPVEVITLDDDDDDEVTVASPPPALTPAPPAVAASTGYPVPPSVRSPLRPSSIPSSFHRVSTAPPSNAFRPFSNPSAGGTPMASAFPAPPPPLEGPSRASVDDSCSILNAPWHSRPQPPSGARNTNCHVNPPQAPEGFPCFNNLPTGLAPVSHPGPPSSCGRRSLTLSPTGTAPDSTTGVGPDEMEEDEEDVRPCKRPCEQPSGVGANEQPQPRVLPLAQFGASDISFWNGNHEEDHVLQPPQGGKKRAGYRVYNTDQDGYEDDDEEDDDEVVSRGRSSCSPDWFMHQYQWLLSSPEDVFADQPPPVLTAMGPTTPTMELHAASSPPALQPVISSTTISPKRRRGRPRKKREEDMVSLVGSSADSSSSVRRPGPGRPRLRVK